MAGSGLGLEISNEAQENIESQEHILVITKVVMGETCDCKMLARYNQREEKNGMSCRWFSKLFMVLLWLGFINTSTILILLWIKNSNDPQMVWCIIKSQVEIYGMVDAIILSLLTALIIITIGKLLWWVILCNLSILAFPSENHRLWKVFAVKCLDY